MNIPVRFNEVVKRFNRVDVLSKLSFSLCQNEFVALVGNNGCGKTTTINILCNLITYDAGEVFVFDKKVTPSYISYKNLIGVLLSKPILVNEFTPDEYLKFVCKFRKVDSNECQKRIQTLINDFEISNYKSKIIGNYSSGDQIKISLASAIIHNPQILILDEPFVFIDNQTVEFVLNLLSSFKNKMTILITSHNLDLISVLCDRFLIMDEGKIIDDIAKDVTTSVESIKSLIKERVVKSKRNIESLSWLK